MTSSRALRPWQLSGPPRPPLSARQCLRLTTSARLSAPATARTITSPPSPPSPPSGPPRGTYFSRRKLQQPGPPSPPLTYRITRSTNMGWKILVRIYQLVIRDHDSRRHLKGVQLPGRRVLPSIPSTWRGRGDGAPRSSPSVL